MNTTLYKERLLEEKRLLERELETLGRINPDNASDWEPTAQELNIDHAEIEERATEITDFEERSAVEVKLEDRLNTVIRAIGRIDAGTYGSCSACNNPIEERRLDANPAAETCIAHMG
jgi:RNA polymerase-binding transcription factor DksA